jgi:hypothetical protein
MADNADCGRLAKSAGRAFFNLRAEQYRLPLKSERGGL